MRIFFTLILSLVFLSSFSSVFAQGEGSSGSGGMTLQESKRIGSDVILPPIPERGGMPFSGQNHFYSLVFRGNGESIVTLRVALTNTSETQALKEVTLRIPRLTDLKDLSAYQIFAQPPCVRYEQAASPVIYPYNATCAEYGEPDYYSYYGGGKYQKADTQFSGDTLKITLTEALNPQKTGSFFVYFRGFGLAQPTLFGGYKYTFESFKVEDQINQLNIGINSDSDLFLKGVKGEVDYREQASSALKGMPAADAGAMANPQVDRYISQIGYGQITKSVSNLASLESYKVEGMFADSRVKLYGKEMLVVLGVFILLTIVAVFVVRYFAKKSNVVVVGNDKKMTSSLVSHLGFAAGVSFASALVTAGFTVGLYAVANLINDIVDYQYQALVMILIIVVAFAVYLMLLLGPAIFMAVKRGIGWGMGTFALSVAWLVLFTLVALVILFVFRGESMYPPIPYGAMEKGVQTMEGMPAIDLAPQEEVVE